MIIRNILETIKIGLLVVVILSMNGYLSEQDRHMSYEREYMEESLRYDSLINRKASDLIINELDKRNNGKNRIL
jgi:hypothetical protein